MRRNLGQVVLDSKNGFQIALEKEGRSLSQRIDERRNLYLKQNYDYKKATLEAHKDLMRYLIALPAEHFDMLAADLSHLIERSILQDIHSGNILSGEDGIGLIDIYATGSVAPALRKDNKGKNNLENLKQRFSRERIEPERDEELSLLIGIVKQRINEAGHKFRLPENGAENRRMTRQRGIIFHRPQRIEGIENLQLNNKNGTAALRLKLAQIEDRLGMNKWEK